MGSTSTKEASPVIDRHDHNKINNDTGASAEFVLGLVSCILLIVAAVAVLVNYAAKKCVKSVVTAVKTEAVSAFHV